MAELKTWTRVRMRERPDTLDPIWHGVRNDGQNFMAPNEETLQTFLDPNCNCQHPPLKELCPVHHKKTIGAKGISECDPDLA